MVKHGARGHGNERVLSDIGILSSCPESHRNKKGYFLTELGIISIKLD